MHMERDITLNAGRIPQVIGTAHHSISFKRRHLSSRAFSQAVPGGIAAALGALFGAWLLDLHGASRDSEKTAAAEPVPVLASYTHGELFDPTFIRGSIAGPLAQSVALEASRESIP